MNGASISHWGIVTWPDDQWKENIFIDGDGSVSKMEDSLPSTMQIMLPHFRPVVQVPKRS